jgi:hypothetical protein
MLALPPHGKKERTMTRTSSFSVRVERPGKAFGEAMSEIRSWLDSHKIQPAAFNSDTKAVDAVTFEIKFQREDEAHLFEQAFT